MPDWLVNDAWLTFGRIRTIHLTEQLQADLLQERQSLASPAASAVAPATVRLLSLSFDGAHDTPAALQAYARQLQADPSVWRFLRVPDPVEMAQLLRRFGVVVVPDGRGDFEHNAALLVVGPQGRLVRVFDIAERELALNYARHLARSQSQASSAVSAVRAFAGANAAAFMPLPPFISLERFFADRTAGLPPCPAGGGLGGGHGTGGWRAAGSIANQQKNTLTRLALVSGSVSP